MFLTPVEDFRESHTIQRQRHPSYGENIPDKKKAPNLRALKNCSKTRWSTCLAYTYQDAL